MSVPAIVEAKGLAKRFVKRLDLAGRIAARLGAQVAAPPQYWRSQPREFKDLFAGLVFGAR